MNKLLRISALIFLPLFTTGCFVAYPKNAAEFRKIMPESWGGEKTSFNVKRPYKKVSATFKKYAYKCFNTNIIEQVSDKYGTRTMNHEFNPTLKIGKSKLVLYVQKKFKGEKLDLKKFPSKGIYYVVADAYKISKNKTRIDIYGSSFGFTGFQRGIKNWAKGSPLGCPDLTK